MPTDFNGTWVSGRSQGWKELLEAMKVPVEKMSADLRVTDAISQSGDDITITSTNSMDATSKKVIVIKVGSNFTQDIMGQTVESTTAWDGGKLVCTGVDGRGGTVREIVDGEMLVTITFGSQTAKTYFAKQ